MSMNDECRWESIGSGEYHHELSRSWWAQGSVHGGYVLALAMSVIETELADSGMSVQQISLHYLRPFVDGPLRAEVELMRRGRRLAVVNVRLFSCGKLAGVAVASTATWRTTGEVVLVDPPVVEPFAADRCSPDLRGITPIHQRVSMQPVVWEIEGRTSRSGGWVTLRSDEVVDHRWVAVLTDLWAPAVYRAWSPRHVVTTVDLTYHARQQLPSPMLPAGSPLLVALTNRVSAGGFVDEDVEVWSSSGTLIAQSRQMRLVHELSS